MNKLYNYFFTPITGLFKSAGNIPSIYIILFVHRGLCLVCIIPCEKILHETIFFICLDPCCSPHSCHTELFNYSKYI